MLIAATVSDGSALFPPPPLMNDCSADLAQWIAACAVLLPLLGGWQAQARHRKPYAGEALLG